MIEQFCRKWFAAGGSVPTSHPCFLEKVLRTGEFVIILQYNQDSYCHDCHCSHESWPLASSTTKSPAFVSLDSYPNKKAGLSWNREIKAEEWMVTKPNILKRCETLTHRNPDRVGFQDFFLSSSLIYLNWGVLLSRSITSGKETSIVIYIIKVTCSC